MSKEPNKMEEILKEQIEILQVETHNDELGICFSKQNGEYICAVDWNGGEIRFKLKFCQSEVDKERERIYNYLLNEEARMAKNKIESDFENGYSIALDDIAKWIKTFIN